MSGGDDEGDFEDAHLVHRSWLPSPLSHRAKVPLGLPTKVHPVEIT